MSVWSCSPSVPAVVEGLVLIKKEQKWNSWTWMKQTPPNVCLTNEQGNLFNGVISFLFFLNVLFLRESKLKSFPQLRFCRWAVSAGMRSLWRTGGWGKGHWMVSRQYSLHLMPWVVKTISRFGVKFWRCCTRAKKRGERQEALECAEGVLCLAGHINSNCFKGKVEVAEQQSPELLSGLLWVVLSVQTLGSVSEQGRRALLRRCLSFLLFYFSDSILL